MCFYILYDFCLKNFKENRATRKVPVINCHTLMKLEFSKKNFDKCSNFKFHEN